MNYSEQAFRDRKGNKKLNVSYNRKVGRRGNLRASVTRLFSGKQRRAFSMNFSMPLGNRTNVSISTSAQSGLKKTRLRMSRNRPAGSGLGYRLDAGLGISDSRKAELTASNEIGHLYSGCRPVPRTDGLAWQRKWRRGYSLRGTHF